MFDKEGMNQIVSAAVVAALEDKAIPLLAQLVEGILTVKVDEYGKTDGYGRKDQTYLEYMTKRQLGFTIERTISEWITTQTETLTAQITAQLSVDGGIARVLVDRITERASSGKFAVSVKLTEENDYA